MPVPPFLKTAISYINAADKIENIAEKWYKRSKKGKPEPEQTDISEYKGRLDALEDNDRLLASVVESMAARMMVLLGVSVMTTAVAIVAIVITFIR